MTIETLKSNITTLLSTYGYEIEIQIIPASELHHTFSSVPCVTAKFINDDSHNVVSLCNYSSMAKRNIETECYCDDYGEFAEYGHFEECKEMENAIAPKAYKEMLDEIDKYNNANQN